VREANIATRKEVMTGATEFANLDEAPVSVLDAAPIVPTPSGEAAIKFEALSPMRLAAAFERLRDRSDRRFQHTGARPKVFLATLGTPADFGARAAFAKSLFEAGGIEAVDGEGFAELAGMADAFRASGTAMACLCSSDKVYASQAAAAAKALRAAGARHIYLAGRAGEQEAALRAAGVNGFVFVGVDALIVLEEAYRYTE
jgi:methylmalonyl-CoA mutase